MLKYEQFLLETNRDNIVTVILDSLEQTLTSMVEKIESAAISDGKRHFSNWQKEMTKLSLTYDLIKSIETYTLSTDELISFNSYTSVKGNIEISAKISRGEEIFSLQTEAIYAGGYNIQKLHYRYITKTNLPRTKSDVITKMYAEKIKKMTKLQKFNLEIENNLKSIVLDEERILKNSALTDDQIFDIIVKDDKYRTLTKTWDEIPPGAPAKEWGEEKWKEHQKEYITSSILHWKTVNIKWSQQHKDAMLKNNEKLQQKLNSYL